LLKDPSVYQELEDKSALLEKGFKEAAANAGISTSMNRVGSMFSTFFTKVKVKDYATATSSDTKLFASYFEQMLKRGIYFAPSQFEAGFMSLAHTTEDIEKTVEAAAKAFQSLS
jgi:glutamate-1-semialdehyde 2,1-aminomutase